MVSTSKWAPHQKCLSRNAPTGASTGNSRPVLMMTREDRNRPRATGRKGRKMTVFEELTKGMKFGEPVEDIKKNMVKVFNKNFNCPPWNDAYEEGCKEFTSCESCWFGYINSEAE